MEQVLTSVGLKVGRQNYTYHSAGEVYTGQNIYGILQAPRGDATEAIVLVAAWKTVEEQFNRNGVSLALTLVRYFKRTSRAGRHLLHELTTGQVGRFGRKILFSSFLPTVKPEPRLGSTLTTMLTIPTSSLLYP